MYGLDSYHSSQDMFLNVPTIHKTVTEQKLITAWSRELTFFCLEFKDHEGNKKCLSTVIHWTSLKLWKDITEDMMTDIYADMANKSKENVRHEKFQHLRRPFDNFFFKFLVYFSF